MMRAESHDGGLQSEAAGVKNKIKLFEEKMHRKSEVSDVSKQSYGAITKDKRDCVKEEESVPKPLRFLAETDVTNNNRKAVLGKDKNADLNLETACKSFSKSKQDLVSELRFIEKLRELYIEKLTEKTQDPATTIYSEEDDEDEYHYIVEAYNPVDFDDHQDEKIYENIRCVSTKNFVMDNNRKLEWKTSSSLMEDQWKCINNSSEKKEHLIEEMINTEEKYISVLEKIVKHYIPYLNEIKLPEHLAGKQHILFGNIAEIYIETENFLAALKTFGNNREKVAEIFLAFEMLFQLYPLYCKNIPKAYDYLAEFQEFAKGKRERLDLGSYLLAPVERLEEYKLFLTDLYKKQPRSAAIQAGLDMVKAAMSRASNYLTIESIKCCPINLNEAGSLIMREKFVIRIDKIAEVFESMKDEEIFSYVDSIKMTDIMLLQNEPLTIKLVNYTKRKQTKDQSVCVLKAKSSEIKLLWRKAIEERLWKQANKCKDEVNARYSKVLQQNVNGQKIERANTLPASARPNI